ncbi:hypothetical protein [Desulfovibrio sp. ZJ200]|uniref:hypothetical protein n=1 Tax=Desulfovibrio sp. ZJ200 TaxID=2709792 RepID=UPI0013EC67FB|nr:hypothetical protein [Desulfovibrio sp. ZJ200]
MTDETRIMASRGTVPAPEGVESSTRSTREESPKTTPNPQAKEKETMNGNNETTYNALHEETSMAEHEISSQQPPRKKRNTMKDVSKKINQLRELAKHGRSREDICTILAISLQGFETLRHKLNDLDRTYYDIPHEKADRTNKVGKSGIMVTADRLMAMGAAEIFAAGTPISILFDGECILIQRAGAKNSSLRREEPQPDTLEADMAREVESIFGVEVEAA